MSFTFSIALGGNIGKSICEDSMIDVCKEILKTAEKNNVKIHLPLDAICSLDFDNNSSSEVFDIMNIGDSYQGMDAGPSTLKSFKKVILRSKTILWNGPIGVFEFSNFSNGTKALGKYISESTDKGAFHWLGRRLCCCCEGFWNSKQYELCIYRWRGNARKLRRKTLPGINALLS